MAAFLLFPHLLFAPPLYIWIAEGRGSIELLGNLAWGVRFQLGGARKDVKAVSEHVRGCLCEIDPNLIWGAAAWNTFQ